VVLQVCCVVLWVAEAVHDASRDNRVLYGLVCFRLQVLCDEKVRADGSGGVVEVLYYVSIKLPHNQDIKNTFKVLRRIS